MTIKWRRWEIEGFGIGDFLDCGFWILDLGLKISIHRRQVQRKRHLFLQNVSIQIESPFMLFAAKCPICHFNQTSP
jgi:hypothetical protein